MTQPNPFSLNRDRSRAAFARAKRLIPGGVNSPARAFGAVGGEPPFVARGEGPYLYDIDGHRYLDYVGSWGPLILGHAHPRVVEAVSAALRDGASFGAPTERESELAELIIEAVPSIEATRFMPPVAIIVPLVLMYKVAGMRDTDNLFLGYIGLIVVHGLMNLPIAVLLMKSFFDDVPKDVDEAAMIDGATRWQTFRRIVLPMVRGGVAAAAVLCFIFSWTEFLLSLFLTTIIRTVPVKITGLLASYSAAKEW